MRLNEQRPHPKLSWLTPRAFAEALRGHAAGGAAQPGDSAPLASTTPPNQGSNLIPAAAGHLSRTRSQGHSEDWELLKKVGVLPCAKGALGRQAVKVMRPMQPGDVSATYADISRLNALCGYAPKVALEEGLPRFVDWYLARQG